MRPSSAPTLHDEEKSSVRLTKSEKEVYEFIKARGELLISELPTRMSGFIPNLKNKGVIEVFKKKASIRASRKRKFVRIRSPKRDA